MKGWIVILVPAYGAIETKFFSDEEFAYDDAVEFMDENFGEQLHSRGLVHWIDSETAPAENVRFRREKT